jgi:SOS-response transcriptional repressor LexA
MDAKQIRRANLASIIAKEGKAAAVAEKVGTAAAYLSQILSGKTKANVGDDLARRVETAYGKPYGWMDERHHKNLADPIYMAQQAENAGNVSPGPDLRGKVPLISWVQAGAFTDTVDLLHPGEAYEWIPSTVQKQAHTFALRVEGDSMEPLFPPGTILIVEPGLEAHAGSFVIVKNGEEEATFKQLVKDGADWYLKPLNARYPIKPFSSGHIVGVVRAAQQTFA